MPQPKSTPEIPNVIHTLVQKYIEDAKTASQRIDILLRNLSKRI